MTPIIPTWLVLLGMVALATIELRNCFRRTPVGVHFEIRPFWLAMLLWAAWSTSKHVEITLDGPLLLRQIAAMADGSTP